MKLPSQSIVFPSFFGGIDLNDVIEILNLIPQACFLIDVSSNKIRLANQEAIHLTGYSPQELFNFPLTRLFPYSFTDLYHLSEQTQPHKIILADQSTLDGFAQFRLLSERKKWTLLTFTPLQKPSSSLSSNQATPILWDVLEWVSLFLEDTQINILLTRSIEIIAKITGSDHAFIYYALPNQTRLSCIAHYGSAPFLPDHLPVDVLVSHSAIKLFSPESPSSEFLFQAALSRDQQYLVTVPLGEPNARIGLLILASASPELSQLTPPQWDTVGQLITSIIQFHNQLHNLSHDLSSQMRENHIHRKVEQNIQQGMLIISADLRILHLNAAAETILGYTASEVQNKALTSFLISENDLSPHLHKAMGGETNELVSSIRLYRRSGQSFLADLSLIPISFEQKPNGLVILIQDRTEQETLLKQSMRLEQRAILGEFTTIFAHEVRNPINNISSNLQWMAMNIPADDPNQAMISRMLQNCERLNDLMDTILSYNRINDVPMEKLELNVLVKRILDRNMMKLNQANINVSYQCEPSLPPIKGNRRALEQVFANLIDNAMQVMRENGGNLTVKVHTYTQLDNHPMLEVSIADSGPGIPDEYKDKIFKVSFTTKPNGTGIGLMITQKIVQAHQGWIDYDSIPGGTVFYVRLPIQDSTTESLNA